MAPEFDALARIFVAERLTADDVSLLIKHIRPAAVRRYFHDCVDDTQELDRLDCGWRSLTATTTRIRVREYRLDLLCQDYLRYIACAALVLSTKMYRSTLTWQTTDLWLDRVRSLLPDPPSDWEPGAGH